ELRELRYAALLHDFGKVAVREDVLLKDRKLRPQDLERLCHRVELLMVAELTHYERERCRWLLEHGADGFAARDGLLRTRCDERREWLASFLQRVHEVNEGAVREPAEHMSELLHLRFTDGT